MDRRTFAKSLAGLGAMPFVVNAASAATEGGAGMLELMGGSITDVPGIKLGHHTLTKRPTGCTVLLCEEGASAGVDVRGSAPGTRETDLLDPINYVQQVQAILLSGGSAYGLAAATGVMRYLEENNLGFKIGKGVVPIVPAAILMDLGVGDFSVRPDEEAGYLACQAAKAEASGEGNIGAGAGATVGKMFGMDYAMKGGLGTASYKVPGTEIVVGAIVAVNAVGDVYAPNSRQILAGARTEDGKGFRDTMSAIMQGHGVVKSGGANTTIGAIATNVPFDKAQLKKIAGMAHDGFARTINPIHTMWDGDTIFALSTGKAKDVEADVTAIGAIAATVMAEAVARAVVNADSLKDLNLPAYKDYAPQ
ncbi:P1 family peptidase [Brucella anthropi]|jgi:L-aminopeptidase/D-esterase-like protein|uniref:P1 family peptidase n=2 Tax=Brucella TaxID=234 RepID=A0A256GIW7_9HYPH|nr:MULTISPECIES: P1 family peptidase [Brucella/Ochrobactrum group]MCR5941414.1 P1 family peptidase [Ochrobactrum sp. XJ1]QOD65097.1 P1 family peptidase [Ochrobactrum sp. MT180101]QTN05364.1 peptidase S58 family protein [Ochrobactrum sp. EEELCW01]RNL47515.1 peptidase S58 family protein [Ochrobactrum sp. MH181795]KAB2704874.1 P1 family peptidase [Brucella lupini]